MGGIKFAPRLILIVGLGPDLWVEGGLISEGLEGLEGLLILKCRCL